MEETKSPIRRDVILIAVLAAVGVLVLLVMLVFTQKGQTVQVRQDGVVTAEYPLSQDRTVDIPFVNGGHNVLVIHNGEAWVEEADCPDALCQKTGRISRTGQSVICLPHRLVIEITGGEVQESSAVDILVK